MGPFATKLPLIVMVGGAIVILILGLALLGILPGSRPPKPKEVTLQFWGIDEIDTQWNELITAFQKRFPHIKVGYQRVPKEIYEEALLNALAEGKGPDIFMLKNAWVQKYERKIAPMPQEFHFTPTDFVQSFVDIAAGDLITDEGAIMGVPLFVETPALFYRKDLFNTAGIASAPKNWEDLAALAERFTKKTPIGDIVRSGFAIGTGKNVAHEMEILSGIFFQYGEPVTRRRTTDVLLGEGADRAMALYTSFANPRVKNFSWSARLASSLDAFAEGDAVMAIGFPQDIAVIRAKNPHLDFGVSFFPQRKDEETATLFGSYFFPAISATSLSQTEAWQFLLFASAREGASLYLTATGRTPARRDLLSQGSPSPIADVFFRQALIAKSWRIGDEARNRKAFQDAIEQITTNALSVGETVKQLSDRLELFSL